MFKLARKCLISLAGSVMLQQIAFAELPITAILNQWAENEYRSACAFPLPPNTKAVYILEWHLKEAPGEIERLRAEIEGKPDHPSRDRYERLTAYARGLLDIECQTIWTQGPDRWRISSDYDGRLASLTPADYVLMPHRAWQRSRDIVLIDPEKPADNHNIRPLGEAFTTNLRTMIYGGLGLLAIPGTQMAYVSRGGDDFTIRMRNGPSIEVEIECTWDFSTGQGIQHSAKYIKALNNHSGRRYVFSEWAVDPYLNRTIAGRVEIYNPKNELDTVIRWQSASMVSDQEFHALTDDPSMEKPDPFRGNIRVNRVRDLRGSEWTETKIGQDGLPSTVPIANTPSANANRWLAYTGWVSAGLVAFIIVMLRFRRQA